MQSPHLSLYTHTKPLHRSAPILISASHAAARSAQARPLALLAISPGMSAAADCTTDSEVPSDNRFTAQQFNTCTHVRPCDELLSNVRPAQSLELALEFLMDAHPL